MTVDPRVSTSPVAEGRPVTQTETIDWKELWPLMRLAEETQAELDSSVVFHADIGPLLRAYGFRRENLFHLHSLLDAMRDIGKIFEGYQSTLRDTGFSNSDIESLAIIYNTHRNTLQVQLYQLLPLEIIEHSIASIEAVISEADVCDFEYGLPIAGHQVRYGRAIRRRAGIPDPKPHDPSMAAPRLEPGETDKGHDVRSWAHIFLLVTMLQDLETLRPQRDASAQQCADAIEHFCHQTLAFMADEFDLDLQRMLRWRD